MLSRLLRLSPTGVRSRRLARIERARRCGAAVRAAVSGVLLPALLVLAACAPLRGPADGAPQPAEGGAVPVTSGGRASASAHGSGAVVAPSGPHARSAAAPVQPGARPPPRAAQASAVTASAPLPAVLAYRDLRKLIDEGKGDLAALRARLLGRTLQVSLQVTGPHSLMVARADRIYFICRQRPPSFKGGPVKAEVLAYDETLKGEPMVTLSRCPP